MCVIVCLCINFICSVQSVTDLHSPSGILSDRVNRVPLAAQQPTTPGGRHAPHAPHRGPHATKLHHISAVGECPQTDIDPSLARSKSPQSCANGAALRTMQRSALLRVLRVARTHPHRWVRAPFSAAAGQLNLAPAGRQFEASDIQLGCIWLSGLIDRGVESLDIDPGQEQADGLVAAALRAGITDFDTAPLYGYGLSEERLGAALAAAGPELAQRAVIYTKM